MSDEDVGSWGQLVAARYRGSVAVLAGGTLIFAVDTYVTASLLPSAVAEIGGAAFYAWPTTVFLLAAVVASALVSRVLASIETGRAYLLGLVVFAVGSVTDAVAPSMAVLVVGRLVQGLGGGLLAGMGYALIRITLPRPLWTRGSAVIAAMWGVALIVGPGLGGVLADLGLWRWAFGVLAAACAVIAAVVPRVLTGGRGGPSVAPVPVGSVVLVGATAGVLSVAGLADDPRVVGGGLAVAAVLLVGFVRHERRSRAGILPRATFRRGSALRWVYALSAVLVGVSGVEVFVPLIGQRVAGLSPVLAGFLGVALGAGWVTGELVSASARRPRPRALLGPVMLAVGVAVVPVALGFLGALGNGLGAGVAALGLAVAGIGVGTAWPHLAAAAIGGDLGGDATGAEEDAREADKASAAVTTVQMLAVSLGTALGGVTLSVGAGDDAVGARWLFVTFAVVAAVGALIAPAAARAVPERV